jgi:hypothetical protein
MEHPAPDKLIDLLRVESGAFDQTLHCMGREPKLGKTAENRPRLDKGGPHSSDDGNALGVWHGKSSIKRKNCSKFKVRGKWKEAGNPLDN